MSIDESKKEAQARQLEELERVCAEFQAVTQSTEPIDKEACSGAVKRLYAQYGRPTPKIIWAQSPWQMMVLLVLCQAMPLEKLLWDHRRALEQEMENPLWRLALSELNAQISATDLMALKARSSLVKDLSISDSKNPFQAYAEHSPCLTGFKCWHSIMSRIPPGRRVSLVENLATALDRQFSRKEFAESFDRLERLHSDHRATINQLLVQLNSISFHPLETVLRPYRSTASEATPKETSPLKPSAILDYTPFEGWRGEAVPGAAGLYLTQVFRNIWWASWESECLPLFEFFAGSFAHSPMAERQRNQLKTTCDLACLATAYLFYEQICFVCERPTRDERDDQFRLHSETGTALAFRDGFELYSWHGATVPPWIINSRHLITPRRIESELNIAIRRIMIEQYGTERFIIDSGAEVISTDEFGTLYGKHIPGDEPLIMVRVVNKTKNADGTLGEYFLRVPPNIHTPREAIAWTFGMDAKEYKPQVET